MTEDQESEGGPTSEEIYEAFKEYQGHGVIEYVLPTTPLGEEWILGVDGQIQKLIGNGQAMAWLAGAASVAGFLARRTGLRL